MIQRVSDFSDDVLDRSCRMDLFKTFSRFDDVIFVRWRHTCVIFWQHLQGYIPFQGSQLFNNCERWKAMARDPGYILPANSPSWEWRCRWYSRGLIVPGNAWNTLKFYLVLGFWFFLQKIEIYSFFPRFNLKPQLLSLWSLSTFLKR